MANELQNVLTGDQLQRCEAARRDLSEARKLLAAAMKCEMDCQGYPDVVDMLDRKLAQVMQHFGRG